jgi:hypothetical protein
MSNELSPEQRELLTRLFESELAALRDAAVGAGATPAAVEDIVEDRRRALEEPGAEDRDSR